jgi:protein phosphatase
MAADIAIHTFADKLEEKLNDLKENVNDLFERYLPNYIEKFLHLSIDYANEAVWKAASIGKGKPGMCTTLLCTVIYKHHVWILSVGDSRMYEIAPLPRQITKDQSLVQSLLDAGQISEENAKYHPQKNVIFSAVGANKKVEGDFYHIEQPAKRYLLCSDGLSDYMDVYSFDDLFSAAYSPEELCKVLIQKSNALGGKDNITVLIIEID